MAGGYTEADVTSFSKVLTGWSMVHGWQADNSAHGGHAGNRGQFIFRPGWHEPGSFEVAGKLYAAGGIEQGEAVLRDLAIHPSTAEHLAFKMVLHFITDQPTAAMVEPLKAAFLSTRGNLGAMARALIDLPEAWTLPLAKLRTPYEVAIANFRATEQPVWLEAQRSNVYEPLRALSNMPWERPTPDGYSDLSQAWLNPNAMRVRAEAAMLFTRVFARNITVAPAALAESLFDDALSSQSRAAVAAAPDAFHGLCTLLMTPEFQRR